MKKAIRIQTEDFSLAEEYAQMRLRTEGQVGAITSFTGLVRDVADQEDVLGLELEHYPGMTEESIKTIVEKAQERWSLVDVLVIHRVGRLLGSDQIVLVLVASSHRPDAFAACEFIMDFLKTEAVFWKKEVRSESNVWISSTDGDRSRRDGWKGSS